MKSPFLRKLLLSIFLTYTSASCASDESKLNNTTKEDTIAMDNKIDACNNDNAVFQSQLKINFIIEDILKDYSGIGGGGIRSIKLVATNKYEVSISREERIDVFTYELNMDSSCNITLINKSESTINF